jgi:type IV secretion system protein TrbL
METAPFTSITFLNWIENFFVTHSVQGLVRLYPQAIYLLVVFGMIDLCTTWTLYEGDLRISKIIARVIKIGFFFFLVVNWKDICSMLLSGFAKAGGLAAGLDVSSQELLKPSGILKIGFKITNNLSNDIKNFGITDIGKIVMYYTGIALTLVSFFIMAMMLLVTIIEFHIFSSLAIILLPFGSLKYTSFLFQRVISAVFSFAIKLMVTYFILGLISSQLKNIPVIASNPSFAAILQAGSANVVLAYLMFKIPALAGSLMNGQPSMDIGSFVKGAVTGAASTAVGMATGGASKALSAAGNFQATLAAARTASNGDGKLHRTGSTGSQQHFSRDTGNGKSVANNFARITAGQMAANSFIGRALMRGANNSINHRQDWENFGSGNWKQREQGNRNVYRA